jgi:hypothetical protein
MIDINQPRGRIPLPSHAKAIIRPWWISRSLILADALQAALDGDGWADVGGVQRNVEWLTDAALYAEHQIETLAKEG